MKKRALWLLLLVGYEAIRLLVLVGCILGAQENPGGTVLSASGKVGFLLLLIPQALFVYMPLMVYSDKNTYIQYLPLYGVGKLLSLWIGGVALFFFWKPFITQLISYSVDVLGILFIGWGAFLPFEGLAAFGAYRWYKNYQRSQGNMVYLEDKQALSQEGGT
ncbi:MAG TPA: hypothetical protein PLW34_06345 [Termitinemataceae bacterium]|jgi:FtsH-binding integral membrane protein|uniref:hypothetical protein n=1 Tax=Treponema sp. J25 TaxID=2094121 RepID=UPI001048AE66|nr:hypothetical protein [Treponema sp. J25]TCW60692.1 hypothetical protein C5O22_10125 [Treponema sp. J25]HOJ99162.1 hypothetical protein [Termitinemataceae bacterium]HOM23201.1 hypothetical protein [Termitinemataceae bacterium]HPQ00387.1 hypothetical protein [Termitinemataceae bacterium]